MTMGRIGHVLVAEDNAVNQRLVTLVLESAGYDVDAVGNGAEAVEAAVRGAYDAVLLDCQMPVMDGYDAATEIRRRANGGARVPIIAVTANAMHGDAERALAAGMDAHLTKPIDLQLLQDTVARLVAAGPLRGDGLEEGPDQTPAAGPAWEMPSL